MEEKKNKYGLGWAPGARREKSATLLCILCFCGLTRACTRAKLPQATSNADLSSRVGQPGICRSTGLSSRLSDFCWLISSLPCSHLLTDLLLTGSFCRLTLLCSPGDLPSLVLFRSRGRSRVQALGVGFTPNRQRNLLTGTYLHPQKWMPLIVPLKKTPIKTEIMVDIQYIFSTQIIVFIFCSVFGDS